MTNVSPASDEVEAPPDGGVAGTGSGVLAGSRMLRYVVSRSTDARFTAICSAGVVLGWAPAEDGVVDVGTGPAIPASGSGPSATRRRTSAYSS